MRSPAAQRNRPQSAPLQAHLAIGLMVLAVWSAAARADTRLDLDPNASSVGFQLSTTWHGVEGKTSHVTGQITSPSGKIFEDGRVHVEVQAATLDTGNGRRDKTMRDDCLQTSRFPRITFASTGPPVTLSTVRDTAGKLVEVSFTTPGDLTIHGVTRQVSLPVTARAEGRAWEMTGEIGVKLSQFQIPDPSIVVNRVKDDVKVTFKVQTVAASQAAAGSPD